MKRLIAYDSKQEEAVAEQYDGIIQSGEDKRSDSPLGGQVEALKRQ